MPADFSGLAKTLATHYQLNDGQGPLFSRHRGVAEVVVTPRSGLIGERAYTGMVTDSGDLVVLAIQRNGEDLGPRETALGAGDTLLLQGTWGALDEHLPDPDVLVVDSPDLVRRQVAPLGLGAKEAIAVLAGMVLLLATGAVAAMVAGLLAACALVLLRVVSIDQAYRSISWTTVLLVGGMIPLSPPPCRRQEPLSSWPPVLSTSSVTPGPMPSSPGCSC